MSDIILTKLQFTPLTSGVILILPLKISKFGFIKLCCFEFKLAPNEHLITADEWKAYIQKICNVRGNVSKFCNFKGKNQNYPKLML